MAVTRLIEPPSEIKPGSLVDAYLRDSGGEKQDRSVASQLLEVRNYCALYDLQLRRIYKDVAKSGKSIVGRDDFEQMLTDIESEIDNPDALLIWDYARFARNTKDAVRHIANVESCGVLVHSLTDDIPDGEYRELVRVVKHMGNENERKKNSIAVKRELKQLVRLYGAMFGIPPRGFMHEPIKEIVINERTNEIRQLNRWVPDPAIVPLVQRAFTMRAQGETIPKIREATGLFQTVGSYTTFFSNRIYIGVLDYGGETFPNYCEPMIDQSTWDEVQRVGQRRKLPQSNIDHPRRIVSSYILSGLLYCQHCGAAMSGYSMSKYGYYVCSNRKAKHTCDARRIPQAAIERAVFDVLLERMLTLENLLVVQTEMQNVWSGIASESDRISHDLKKQLSAIQAKIRNVTRAIADHGHSSSLLKELVRLEAQETDVKASLGKIDNTPVPVAFTRPQLSEIAEALKLDLLDTKKTRATIRGLVARVVARRTDDQVIAVVHCNKVIGQVPPWGRQLMTLFYPIAISIRKRKAPLRAK